LRKARRKGMTNERLQKERDGSKVGEGMGIRQGWSRHVGRGINSMSRNQDGRARGETMKDGGRGKNGSI
jgi:hypothetical protein